MAKALDPGVRRGDVCVRLEAGSEVLADCRDQALWRLASLLADGGSENRRVLNVLELILGLEPALRGAYLETIGCAEAAKPSIYSCARIAVRFSAKLEKKAILAENCTAPPE